MKLAAVVVAMGAVAFWVGIGLREWQEQQEVANPQRVRVEIRIEPSPIWQVGECPGERVCI